MNPLKSQVKIGTINELGEAMDGLLESAKAEGFRQEGRARLLVELQNGTLKSILDRVDRDVDEGKLDLETSGHVKKALVRVSHAIDNLKLQTTKSQLVCEGRVQGLKQAVDFASKRNKEEADRLRAFLEAVERGDVTVEDGARPDQAGSAASAAADIQQRRAEAKAEREKAEAEAAAAKKKTSKKAGKKAGKKKRSGA